MAVGMAFVHSPQAEFGAARPAEPARPVAPVVVSGAMAPWPIGLTRVDRSAAPELRVGVAETAAPSLGRDHPDEEAPWLTGDAVGPSDPDNAAQTPVGRPSATPGPESAAPPGPAPLAGELAAAPAAPAGGAARNAVAPQRQAPRTAPAPTARAPAPPPPAEPSFFEDPIAYIARLSERERPPGTDFDARQD